MEDPISALLSLHEDLAPATPESERPKFPCGQCGGRGTWVSPLGRVTGPCHACKGSGYFLTDPKTRARARQSRVSRANRIISDGIAAFKAAHPEVYADIEPSSMTGNTFAKSLWEQLNRKGSLSEGQIRAVLNGIEKKRLRAEEAKANTKPMGLGRVREMFDRALSTGLKRPTFRAAGLTLSLAGPNSKNAGAIYVKTSAKADWSDEMEAIYCGKVVGAEFQPTREGTRLNVVESLQKISENPLQAAVEFGRLTGHCACCGRLLTNKESVDRGIGPICAEKWGL